LVPPVARLLVPIDHWQTMLDHVLACMPEEACGIVAGRQGIVAQVRPIENAAHSPFRFRMEPRGQVEALLDLEAQGLELLAIYHSHPATPAYPSPTDIARAFYPDVVYMLVSLMNPEQATLRGFRIVDGKVEEITLEIEDKDESPRTDPRRAARRASRPRAGRAVAALSKRRPARGNARRARR
jgi:proteasome lid subunit RPN8/RPN11